MVLLPDLLLPCVDAPATMPALPPPDYPAIPCRPRVDNPEMPAPTPVALQTAFIVSLAPVLVNGFLHLRLLLWSSESLIRPPSCLRPGCAPKSTAPCIDAAKKRRTAPARWGGWRPSSVATTAPSASSSEGPTVRARYPRPPANVFSRDHSLSEAYHDQQQSARPHDRRRDASAVFTGKVDHVETGDQGLDKREERTTRKGASASRRKESS